MPIWIRSIIFLLLFPGTLGVLLPWAIAGGYHVRSPVMGPVPLAAMGMIIVGIAVLFWCARDFAVRGDGTPAPYDPPLTLVVVGLYRFVRNPMYVGIVTAVAGQALLLRSLGVAVYDAALWFAFHLRVLSYEEPRLTKSFGASYSRYCATVPRWLPRRTLRRRPIPTL
jgi:protein-S-isoprenylcysteine O-methyltransferase Ste14